MRKILSLLLILTLVLTTLPSRNPVHAEEGLGEVVDILNNVNFGALAAHSVSFYLPLSSAQVNTTDYIQIYLNSFTNVTAPTSVSGQYGGTPSFSLSGNYARVTGITITPGARVTIDGITANNPGAYPLYNVAVLITQDEDGLIVKNAGTTYAHDAPGTVSITTSVLSPQGYLSISGRTAPNTFIIFTEFNSVIGTTISDTTGFFIKVFPSLPVLTHTISLYGIDLYNFSTSFIPITIYTPNSQQIAVANLILAPTLQINASQITQGTNLVASGSAMPSGDIVLFTDSPLRTYYTTVTAGGLWNYTINNTSSYVPGDYHIYALVQNGIGGQSLHSNSLGFTILPPGGSSGASCGDITHGDLNCDDSINLTDFSILMYYWGTANLTADINIDGIVNLTDFSILMYWWGT